MDQSIGTMRKGDKKATAPLMAQVAQAQTNLDSTSCQDRTGRVCIR